MRYPKTEFLLDAHDTDCNAYTLAFYGENEGAAIVAGPRLIGGDRMTAMPEVHREPATNADEARAKLRVWIQARGWRWEM